MTHCGTAQERPRAHTNAVSKLRQIQALFSLCSCWIAWQSAVFVISNPLQTTWRPQSCVTESLSAWMHAEHFALQLQSSGSHVLLLTKLWALLAQETTKSHHYFDYIMGPPTHAACPSYSNWDVYMSQTLVHCGTVWVITKRSAGVCCWSGERKHACLQCVFPSSTGGQTSYWQWC